MDTVLWKGPRGPGPIPGLPAPRTKEKHNTMVTFSSVLLNNKENNVCVA